MEAGSDLNAMVKKAPDVRSSPLFSMKHVQLHSLLPPKRPIEFLTLVKIRMKKTLLSAVLTGMFATAAHAQSSVTLYGFIDVGLTYVSNQKVAGSTAGHSTFAMTNASINPDGFGMRGTEDLGGGLKACPARLPSAGCPAALKPGPCVRS